MDSAPYLPPVSGLLTLGESAARQQPWPDYLAMGFTAGHVPELIRMASDPELASADTESLEVWGGLHAWRALGQLRAEAAITPLIRLLRQADDDDWVGMEVPEVLGMIGPAAFEPLRAAMAEWARDDVDPWIANFAADSLKEIASRFPEMRAPVVEALRRQLSRHARQDPDLNALIVGCLMDMKAAEAAPEIEAAFAAGAIAVRIVGDWEDVQVDLGLLAERSTPRPRYNWFAPSPEPRADRPAAPTPRASASPKAGAKRKAAKAARKRNRKRR
jgi:hypothetical protein